MNLINKIFLLAFYPTMAFAADVPGTVDKLTAAVTSWQGLSAMIAIVVAAVAQALADKFTPIYLVAAAIHSIALFFYALDNFLKSILPPKKNNP